jgi:uncharacterized protein (DUF433 family)
LERTTQDVLAFSAEQVCRLTRLSIRQLRYWDDTEFFSPEYAPGYPKRFFSRVYSFRDVVGLYTIAILRKRYHFPLQKLRRVGEYLHRYHDTPWSSLTLYVAGREIVFKEPGKSFNLLTAQAGQYVFPIELEEVARKVEAKATRLRNRRPSQIGQIERNRYVVHNAPVLAGTRVPTAAVWNLREAGYSTQAIIREFPRLRSRDVDVAVQYEEERRHRKTG